MRARTQRQVRSARLSWRLGLASALLLAASVTAAAQVETVTFTSTADGMSGLVSRVIVQQKLDAKNGLHVDAKSFSPDKATSTLVAKLMETGFISPMALARVNLRGNQLRIFGPQLWNHISIVVQPDAGISTLGGLQGKKLAILPRVSGAYNTWALVNQMRGIDVEKSYQMIFGPPPVILGLFHQKEVQAAAIFEPLTTGLLAAKKGVEILRVKDLWREQTGEPMMLTGLAAYQDWLDANPSKARKLAATYLDAHRYIVAHAAAVIEANRDYLKVTNEAHAKLLAERLPEVLPVRWDDKLIANAELITRKAAEFGLIKEVPPGKLFLKFE